MKKLITGINRVVRFARFAKVVANTMEYFVNQLKAEGLVNDDDEKEPGK